MSKYFGILIIVCLLFVPAYASTVERGVYPEVAPENSPEFVEQYRVLIDNSFGGEINASSDQGKTWGKIGNVILPTQKVNTAGYTASLWAGTGEVAATAVNAIHIRTGINTVEGRGIIFSILPFDAIGEIDIPKDWEKSTGEVVSPNSSIYTTILGGRGIFGGGFAPYVGNKVYLLKDGKAVQLESKYIPQVNDLILIVASRPVKYPKEIVFENRFGGFITLKYLDGEEKVIGEVLKPVQGIGRFQGSELSGVGRIRANHPGVIEVDTSPLYETGAFQIVPAAHGMSPEMINARVKTQWLIVGPPAVTEKSPEGIAPLFRYFIAPYYQENDLLAEDWENRLLKRFLVDVKIKGSDKWQPVPAFSVDPNKALPAWADRCLENVTQIRILFPVHLTSYK
ncbi:MAG: hypothetical protein NT099_02865 [Candidatus Saganbacteria bacterium]|nr:hypothetical protein [Candidatus Saganbacteria bacterium]